MNYSNSHLFAIVAVLSSARPLNWHNFLTMIFLIQIIFFPLQFLDTIVDSISLPLPTPQLITAPTKLGDITALV